MTPLLARLARGRQIALVGGGRRGATHAASGRIRRALLRQWSLQQLARGHAHAGTRGYPTGGRVALATAGRALAMSPPGAPMREETR